MNKAFIFLSMIFCHIIDDYYLQGVLANLKQREWWKKNAPQDIYAHDYIMALFMHSFSWSFMVMLPIAVSNKFNIGIRFIFLMAVNMLIHGYVDHMKANKRCINLIQDQSIHLLQIVITSLFWMFDFI